MDKILFPLIILVFTAMIFFRIRHLNRPIYLFGILQKSKRAVITRIVSAGIMILIVYSLIFHYLWGFILFIIDYLIGVSHGIILLHKTKAHAIVPDVFMEGLFKSNKKLISCVIILGFIWWTLIAVYLFKIFLFV